MKQVGIIGSAERVAQVIEPFGEDIWLVEGDNVRLLTAPFSTRMTIVRLRSGELWLHSPVAPTPQRLAAVRRLGTVRHIVAPNKIHSLWIVPWKNVCPRATVWVSPQFSARHPQLPVDAVLGSQPPAAWAGEIDQLVFEGSKIMDEVVFHHRASATLIVADLIQRHDPAAQGWFWTQLKRWGGVLGQNGGTPKDLELSFRDRDAARRSAERALSWDFDRLVVAHGFCATRDARPIVERAFTWAR